MYAVLKLRTYQWLLPWFVPTPQKCGTSTPSLRGVAKYEAKQSAIHFPSLRGTKQSAFANLLQPTKPPVSLLRYALPEYLEERGQIIVIKIA